MSGQPAAPQLTSPGVTASPVVSNRPASTSLGATAGSSLPPFPAVDFPPAPTEALPDSLASRLQAILDAVVDDQPRLGMTAALIVADAGSWSSVAGHDQSGAAVTSATRWGTGSIAKTVVAAEIMRLMEREHLNAGTRASDVIADELHVETNGATILDLLRMRSGLTAHVPPGTVWHYSNGDYIVLGYVIEGVEHRPLGDVLTDDTLDVDGAEGLVFPKNGTVMNAAGPLEADSMSLARWGYALFGNDLVDPKALAMMVTFDENTYGMGVFDFSSDFGIPAAGHLGQEASASAALVVLPTRQTVIVTLSNSGDVNRTYAAAIELATAVAP
jgi:CubicO group peptidase (beta-lactamase class C family)